MQLESHATPAMESPQQRYANLHRAIERGLDSDEVWKELAEVSLKLGHGDEAVRCMRRIRNDGARLALESRLVRLGLCAAADPDDSHSAAPAASDAGTEQARDASSEVRLVDHLVDAFQYQMHQHMPALVLFTTLAFPLVVGVGGFLTAGGSLLLLAAIAALPGLSVLGVVGAMGRQVLLASAEGNGDVPPIPGFGDLVRDARRFLIDAALVVTLLLGPSLGAFACGAPWTTAVPGLVIGAFFSPMAWMLRQLRGDLTALSPVVLMRAIGRTMRSYPALAVVNLLLFAPTAIVAWVVFGRPVWVQIALLGPLAVLPVFVASRLLGTWLEVHRVSLGALVMRVPKVSKPAKAAEKSPAAAPSAPVAVRTARPAAAAKGVAARKENVGTVAAATAAAASVSAAVAAKVSPSPFGELGNATAAAASTFAKATFGAATQPTAKAPASVSSQPFAKAPAGSTSQVAAAKSPLDVVAKALNSTAAAAPTAAAPAAPAAPAPKPPQLERQPRRPDQLRHFEAPNLKRPAGTPPTPVAPRPAPVRVSESAVAKRATAAPKADAAPPVSAKPAPRAIEGRGPQRRPETDTPDLSQMPGAVVVSGRERERRGAAAKKS